MPNKINLMCDSGAFGAWKRGLTLDIDKYIDYIQKNLTNISSYVSLDTIPGSREKMTFHDMEPSAKASHKNHLYMREKGLSPIPVFHQGENFKWLDIMLQDGETYVGISPSLTSPVPVQKNWYNEVFTYLTDSEGRPIVKTHGFGATNINFLKQFPFFTADSTTWALMPSYGRIMVPRRHNGKWDYLNPETVILSDVIVEDINRFEARGKEEQNNIIDYLENEVGVDMFEARNNPETRRFCVLQFFRKFEACVGEVRFQNKKGLFQNLAHDRKGITIKHPTIIFATGTHSNLMNETMNRAKVWNRLLSYFELQFRDPDFLTKYVRDGCWRGKRNTNPKQNWDGKYRKFRTLKLIERHKRGSNA